MNINYSPHFIRQYKKITKKNPHTKEKIKERINLFKQNPHNPKLKLHKLTSTKTQDWSFSITQGIRVIFYYHKKEVIFFNIGSHDQVY